MARMYSDDIVEMSNQSGIAAADRALRARELDRQARQDRLDNALKEAQLQEAGYSFDGNNITQQPGYLSTKALEREKLQRENALADFKLNRLRNAPTFGGGQTSGFGGGASPGSLVPKSFDEYGLPNSYYDPQAELEQKAKEESQKPLSAEASGKFEGARQTVEQIGAVRNLANKENFENRKKGYTKIKMGQKFGITDPTSIRGNIINTIGFGIPKQAVKTSDEDKKFELAVNLIAENNLRARTGAAAPTQEQIREEARQLVGDDTYESFLNRMGVSEKYATGIAEGIRPGSSKKFGPTSVDSVSDVDPLEEEAQAAIASGKDPQAVMARLAQLKAERNG